MSFAFFNQNALAKTTTLSLLETKTLTLEQQLGKKIFFDENLSSPKGQSCASCHDIKTALSDSLQDSPVSLGAVTRRTGTRNTPSAGYSAFSPTFYFDKKEGLYIGGQFLDGRAADLKAQAKIPFLNPDEMNNADEKTVIEKIKASNYIELFKQVYGDTILTDVTKAYDQMAQAIVAFENTANFNQFTSKYDYFLAGRVTLTEQEQKGLALFEDEKKGNCAACHISKTEDGSLPLFTDFTYDNLGTPSNPKILALKGANFIDVGLGQTVGSAENGKFKVPSLRNVAKTAPYMHNGVFKDLKDVVDFYNTRDVDGKWAKPEVATNVNTEELGDLNLTDEEVDAIVVFMKTLTDGYPIEKQSIFSVETGRITLPFVRIEGLKQKDTFYSAQLQKTEGDFFEVVALNQLPTANVLIDKAMPYYSADTGILELPLLTDTDKDEIKSYVQQLLLIPSETGKITFKVLYSKKLD